MATKQVWREKLEKEKKFKSILISYMRGYVTWHESHEKL